MNELKDLAYLKRAIELAKRAETQQEVPIGAVLVLNNEIIGEGWNQPIALHDSTAHAEIIALRAGGKKIGNYRLIDTTLYVTIEPCAMCIGAMIHARVGRLVYGADDPKAGAVKSVFNLLDSKQFNHKIEWQSGLLADECSDLLKKFFAKKRASLREASLGGKAIHVMPALRCARGQAPAGIQEIITMDSAIKSRNDKLYMKNILNIAGYKFITLNKLESLRDQLKALCRRCELKGTILLAEEGINIMLAGSQSNVVLFLNEIKNDLRFADMEFKNSYSNFVPFQRLLIKIKKEIITFNISGIHPEKYAAPKISAQEFKQWLDKNKDMVVLDVRNQCEIAAGKFKDAIDLEIKNFKNFPQATKKLPESIKQKPIVTYCTGGIRCEKAATYLMQQGFKQVFQLQGGILQYFAECGAANFEGECFVFDDRGKLTAKDAI